MPFHSWAEYIETCRPHVQAPSESYPTNPSRPDTKRPYFLDILWGLVADPEADGGSSCPSS